MATNKDKLVTLAEKLLEKEVIFKEDLEEIFGKRPFEKEEEVAKPEPKIEPKIETTTGELPKPEEPIQ